MSLPKSSTKIRSQTDIIRSIRCSITSTPTSAASLPIRCPSSLSSSSDSPLAGSSSRSSRGSQATEQPYTLKCPGDPESGQLMRPDPGQVLSIEPHPAGLGPDETAYCVEQRRLSSAVRSDYSGDLLGHRHEGHVIESSQTTEAHRQILDVQ